VRVRRKTRVSSFLRTPCFISKCHGELLTPFYDAEGIFAIMVILTCDTIRPATQIFLIQSLLISHRSSFLHVITLVAPLSSILALPNSPVPARLLSPLLLSKFLPSLPYDSQMLCEILVILPHVNHRNTGRRHVNGSTQITDE